jgi:UDP-3-O-[3-hydroxymyristoyl] glucosamine N-acyltransferase
MKSPPTLADIADLVGGSLCGNGRITITGVAAISSAAEGDLTWVVQPQYADQLGNCRASAVLVGQDLADLPLPAIRCPDVEAALAQVLAWFCPPLPTPPPGVDPTAKVAPSASLGDGAALGPFVVVEDGAAVGPHTVLHAGVYVGPHARIGRDCRLWNNVVVRERCQLGDRVVIHPNCVIGSDGFGYYMRNGRHNRFPHLGRVVIGNDVEIGACSCVDRSKAGTTVIGAGTKIDNLVQVAHNVEIGENCVLCAQAGIAGSAKLGKWVVLGGQVGIRDNITLHDGVRVAACSCVPQDVSAGVNVAGVPAIEARQFLRVIAATHRSPELLAEMRELTKRIETLEAAANHQPGR